MEVSVGPEPGRTSLRSPPRLARIRSWAAYPVDGASLAIVRIAFGAIGVLVAIRTLANGWVESLYAGPTHHFTYAGFGWVHAPPVWGTYLLVFVIGASAAMVALGWHYRTALVVFLVAFAWLELIEVTTYLNHYWFVTLLGLVLLAVPATACWSIDARRGRDSPRRAGSPKSASKWVPRGAVALVRAQVAVVYVFAGLAKLNTDWLVHGLPLRLWLPSHTDLAIIGPWLDEPWLAIAMSWAGLGFDLLVVPALCFRRTRPFAWAAIVVFHVITWRLFPIGVFPWLMIAASTVFFAPDWPRKLVAAIRRDPRCVPQEVKPERDSPTVGRTSTSVSVAAVVVGIVWILLQVLIPLRHFVVPGDYRWTNEGYRFSWAVLLTEKGGDVTFRVVEPRTGERWIETGSDLYTPNQWRMMATEPELIRQAAHAIAAQHASDGRRVEVRADAFVALNGRPFARLVDPHVDLANEPWRLHQSWIRPAPQSAPLPGR